jgi:hypothetical protein
VFLALVIWLSTIQPTSSAAEGPSVDRRGRGSRAVRRATAHSGRLSTTTPHPATKAGVAVVFLIPVLLFNPIY